VAAEVIIMERRQVSRDNHPRRVSPPLGAFDASLREAARTPMPERPVLGPVPSASGGLRAVNAAIGVWLFVSAFLWPHGDAAFANTMIVGALLAAFGLFAHKPLPRLMCGSLAAWLVLSTLAILPRMDLTFWHNLAAGFAALVVTFMPPPKPRLRAVK
jgi:hypothetical protein